MRTGDVLAIGAVLLALARPAVSADAWKLVWQDEFAGSGLPDAGKWDFEVGGNGWGNHEKEFYTDRRMENVRQEDGVLVLEARKEAWGNQGYTSGRITTRGKSDWKYGRVEVRAKLPTGRGMWPAVWLLPTENVYGGWPKSGELDVMENVGYDPDRIHSNIHCELYNGMAGTNKGSNRVIESPSSTFHVYRMDWYQDRIEYYIDDEILFTYRNPGNGASSWPYDQKFCLVLNVAVGGDWGGIQGIDDGIFPQRMSVDWVRVYQLLPDAPTTLASSTVGNGRIEVSPAKDSYVPADSIALTAIPATGWTFVKWAGDVGGREGTTGIAMSRNRTVQAWFRPEDNLLVNGDFGSGAAAWSGPNYVAPAIGSGGVSGGAMTADIATAGSSNWNAQIFQEGIALRKGKTYTLSFADEAVKDFDVDVSIEHSSAPWDSYLRKIVRATPTRSVHAWTFTMDSATDSTSRVVFNLGLTTGSVKLDDIRLTEGSGTTVVGSRPRWERAQAGDWMSLCRIDGRSRTVVPLAAGEAPLAAARRSIASPGVWLLEAHTGSGTQRRTLVVPQMP